MLVNSSTHLSSELILNFDPFISDNLAYTCDSDNVMNVTCDSISTATYKWIGESGRWLWLVAAFDRDLAAGQGGAAQKVFIGKRPEWR